MLRWIRIAFLTWTALQVTVLSADTLILQDGRSIKGEVSQNDSGNYVVKTKAGQVTFSSVDVAKWEKGDSVAVPVAPPSKPSAPLHESVPEVKAPPAAVMARAAKLVDQGYAALQAADAQAALENFQDAKSLWERQRIRIDLNHPQQFACIQGLGIAYLALGRYEKAGDPLDRIYPSRLRDRCLIINRAILDLVQKTNVSRGVKEMKDFLARQTENDEIALNVFGAGLALAGMDERFSQAPYFQSVVALYDAKNSELEATRSREGRWGAEWIAIDLLKKKRIAQRQGIVEFQQAVEAEQYAAGGVSAAQANADAAATNRISPAILNAALEKAHQQLKSSELRHHAAWKAIPRPDWPKTFAPVLPQSFGGLAFGTPIPAQVAIAIPAPPLVPPPTPKPVASEKIVTTMPPVIPVNPPEVANAPVMKAGKPTVSRYAVAVPVGPDLVVTAAAPLENATEFQLESPDGDSFKGELVRRDPVSKLALIRIAGKRMPYLNLAAGFNGGEVVCWGFPEVIIFVPIAEFLGGSATAPKAGAWTVSLRRHPRLIGAAILDGKGALVGITLGDRDTPATQMAAVTLEQLRAFLGTDAPRTVCSNPNPSGVMQLTASHEAQ